MRAKSIKKNFIFNIISQILTLVLPFITMPYLSRVLGVEGVGQYSYANSIVSYFLLVAVLGTATYGQRAIGYAQQDKEERSRAFWETYILRLCTSSITLIAYAAFIFWGTEKSDFTIFLILTLNIINVIFDITWFFQGMEEFGKIVVTSIISRIAYIVLIFTCVKQSNDLWLYVLFSVGQLVVGNLVLWIFMPKYLCKVKGIRPFHDIKSVLQLFLPTIAIQIYVVLDKSMLGWFNSGYAENGYYEQAEKVSKMTLSLVTALGTVMIPRITRTYKEGDMEQVKAYLYKSYRFVWMMAIPVMFGLIAVSSVFVPIFFGDGYEKCIIIISILSILEIFIGMSNVTGMQYFVPTGKQNILTLTVVVGAVTNLILNLILIPFFASIGAAIATIVAEFCVTLAGFIYVRKKRLYAIKPIITCSWNYWIAGVVMFAAVFGLKYLLPIAVWSLIILIIVGVVVYALMILLLRDVMAMEFVLRFFNILKSKLCRKKVAENVSENDGVIDSSDSNALNEADAQNLKELTGGLSVTEQSGEEKRQDEI